jgi:uncharacterized membrane protein YbhN (UPF0104 family)
LSPADSAAAPVHGQDDHHLAQRVSHASYGSIVVLAVILALEGRTDDPWEVLASVLGAAVATALAEIYADYLGATIRRHRRLTREERHTAAPTSRRDSPPRSFRGSSSSSLRQM